MSNILAFNTPNLEAVDDTVTSLDNTRNLNTALDNVRDNIFFDVDMVPLQRITGMKDRKLQAVINRDTDEVVAVHGSRYELIPNKKIYGTVDRIIQQCNELDTEGMHVEDQLSYQGGRTIRSYVFPQHKVSVGTGDDMLMKLNVINSYDGSTNLRVCMGAYRIVCANGMVVGNSFANYMNRHSSGFNYAEIKARIAASLQNFTEVGKQWEVWAKTPCTNEQAQEITLKLAGKSEKLAGELMDFWYEEKGKLGGSLWALYNALTFWSTHYGVKESSEANKSSIILGRESRVATITNQHFGVAA